VLIAFWNPPGISCFARHNWDRKQYQAAMPFLSTPLVGISIEEWKNSSNLVLQINGKTHDNTYSDLFRSILWTILVRILVFVVGVHVAIEGIVVARNNNECTRNLELRRLTNGVCFMESSASVIVGTLHLLGQGGPMVMPVQIHKLCNTFFYGGCLYSNFIQAIVLREEVLSFKTGLPRRSIWKNYRATLVLSGIFLVGSDLFIGFADPNVFRSGAVFLFYVVCTLCSGAYFVRNAHALSVSLLAYIRNRETLGIFDDETSRHVRRLA
jgi:hypothetical protein